MVSSGRGRARRRFKIRCLEALKAAGLFELARRITSGRVRILCYHGVWLGKREFEGDGLFMHARTIRERFALIRDRGFPVVSLDEAIQGLSGEAPLPPGAVVLTIDDGWFGVWSKLWPLLREFDFPATLYVDTGNLVRQQPVPHVAARYIFNLASEESRTPASCALLDRAVDPSLSFSTRAEALSALRVELGVDAEPFIEERAFSYVCPRELSQMYEEGLNVQLHTHRHKLHRFKREKIIDEIRENREVLANVLNVSQETFKDFCYPAGRTHPSAAQVLATEVGIRSAMTLERRLARAGDDLMNLPRIMDWEGLTPIEFEAELYGVNDLMRAVSVRHRPEAPDPPTSRRPSRSPALPGRRGTAP